MHSLSDYIKAELVSHEVSTALDNIIDLTVRIDFQVQTHHREQHHGVNHRQPFSQIGKEHGSPPSPLASSIFWREFCFLIGAQAGLYSGFQPQSNSQTENKNQEMETAFCRMVSQNLPSWSRHLLWMEYAHNSLTSSSTGLSPF